MLVSVCTHFSLSGLTLHTVFLRGPTDAVILKKVSLGGPVYPMATWQARWHHMLLEKSAYLWDAGHRVTIIWHFREVGVKKNEYPNQTRVMPKFNWPAAIGNNKHQFHQNQRSESETNSTITVQQPDPEEHVHGMFTFIKWRQQGMWWYTETGWKHAPRPVYRLENCSNARAVLELKHAERGRGPGMNHSPGFTTMWPTLIGPRKQTDTLEQTLQNQRDGAWGF